MNKAQYAYDNTGRLEQMGCRGRPNRDLYCGKSNFV
jgi:hypothetical protein